MKTRFIAICLASMMAVQTPVILGQSPNPASSRDWETVKQIPTDEKLVVRKKDGKEIKGEMSNASDSELILYRKNRDESIKREDIQRIWTVSPPNKRKQRVITSLGFGVGLFGSLALAVSTLDSPCGDCNAEKAGFFVILIGATAAGVLIGQKLGAGKRYLIYETP